MISFYCKYIIKYIRNGEFRLICITMYILIILYFLDDIIIMQNMILCNISAILRLYFHN